MIKIIKFMFIIVYHNLKKFNQYLAQLLVLLSFELIYIMYLIKSDILTLPLSWYQIILGFVFPIYIMVWMYVSSSNMYVESSFPMPGYLKVGPLEVIRSWGQSPNEWNWCPDGVSLSFLACKSKIKRYPVLDSDTNQTPNMHTF
jgi:hypothetical protein